MLLKVSLVFIMINKLNTDHALIQIKRLEKVNYTDSTEWSQKDRPSLTDGLLYTGVFIFIYNCHG